MVKNLEKLLRGLGELKRDFSLKEFTTLRIGGKACYFFAPASEDNLVSALRVLKEEGVDYYVLGKGSNLLISSQGLEGVVIKLNFKEITPLREKSIFYLGSSLTIREILKFSLSQSLSAFEFLAGLPATLGGAIVNNASFRGSSVFDCIKRVRVLDPQSEKIFFLEKTKIDYGYRFSSLKGQIVLGAEVEFHPSNQNQIKEKIKEVVTYRLENQEMSKPSAGCIFKNPGEGVSSGKLIEEAGLKGLRKGGARVSLKHANFIVNEGGANSSDVLFLIEYIKEKVYNKFGIVLEEEIERWGC